MPACTYDNPATMARECWQDGRMLCSYSAALLLRKPSTGETQPIPGEHLFFGANVGDWNPGQVVGEGSALPSEIMP